MPEPITICLDRPATHVNVDPGAEIILRGSFVSKHDGSTVDAATTTWPPEAPGGASIDSGGLIDLAGGGFHVTSRNPTTHEVHAVATGDSAPACADFGVAPPCFPLRLVPQARTRLMTVPDWKSSLLGGGPGAPGCFALEVPSSVLPAAANRTLRFLPGAGEMLAVLGALGIATVAWRVHRKRAASPAGRLLSLAKRVRTKLKAADPILAAPLVPAVDTALRAVAERRVDASSTEGLRVASVLQRVDAQLDERVAKARAKEEQEAADRLVRELESAIEAADEASSLSR